MQLTIIGGGALGCLLAFLLAPHATVTVVSATPASVDALRQHGITCYDGEQQATRQVNATLPEEGEPSDLALLAVKSHQTARAAQTAARLLQPDGLLVTLQNGLGNREALADLLGAERVGQGVTMLGATLLGPGLVRLAGRGATVIATQPQPARSAALVALFEAAGLEAGLADDLEALVWGKLVVNCGINALTALLRVPNGALATNEAARALLTKAVREAAAVAAAKGITLPYADPVAQTLAVAHTTAHNHSSMLQDALAGRPSEGAAINGALVAEAQCLGVAVPVNQALAALMQALDSTAESRIAG